MACQTSFTIAILGGGNLEAYVRLHPDDVEKIVGANEEFTVRAKYILGKPNILDIPFLVQGADYVGTSVSAVPEGFEIISVVPASPNFSGVTNREEQDVVVTAIVREDNEHDSPSVERGQLYYVYLDIDTFQPDVEGDDPYESGISRVTGDNDDIPNLWYTEFNEYTYVSWNLPTDAVANQLAVDFRVSVEVARYRDDGSVFYDVEGVRDYTNRLLENLTIGAQLLHDILADDAPGGLVDDGINPLLPGHGELKVDFKIKRASAAGTPTAYNRDGRTITFTYSNRSTFTPLERIPLPRNMTFGLASYVDDRFGVQQRYRLEWEQPYWLGDPTDAAAGFTNYWPQPEFRNTNVVVPQRIVTEEGVRSVSDSLLIHYYQYRYRYNAGAWTAWMDTSNNPQPEVEWPTKLYASTYEVAREFPFGNVEAIPSGRYDFEGRAVLTHQFTLGEVISLTVNI